MAGRETGSRDRKEPGPLLVSPVECLRTLPPAAEGQACFGNVVAPRRVAVAVHGMSLTCRVRYQVARQPRLLGRGQVPVRDDTTVFPVRRCDRNEWQWAARYVKTAYSRCTTGNERDYPASQLTPSSTHTGAG